jgi:hypothetical protein
LKSTKPTGNDWEQGTIAYGSAVTGEKSDTMKRKRQTIYIVIRDGQEFLVPRREFLTAEEVKEIAERERSPEARRRFGLKLREVRRIADKPLKAAIRLLREKMAREEPAELTDAEHEALLVGSPEHVKEEMRWLHKRAQRAAKGDSRPERSGMTDGTENSKGPRNALSGCS